MFDRNLDMVYELNRRKNISIIGNVITLQIILRNEILGNNNLFKVTSTWNKVRLIFVLKGLANSSISKIHGPCSNANPTSCSLYYEPRHIENRYIFIIHGILRTDTYS